MQNWPTCEACGLKHWDEGNFAHIENIKVCADCYHDYYKNNEIVVEWVQDRIKRKKDGR